MTYELKKLIETGIIWQKKGIKVVLATVVALEGSSYRRPGVRMLLADNGKWVGAVSGGCVEKEVYRQAQSVFNTQKAKVMSYDGSYRLGCEGILYILLEPFNISENCYTSFQKAVKERKSFTCDSYYQMDPDRSIDMGSILTIDKESFKLSPIIDPMHLKNLDRFSQEFTPIFQLYIFGAEHDAVALCKMASQIGWEVHIVAPPGEAKTIDYFTGAKSLITPAFDGIETSVFDGNTAVMVMTHSFNKDVRYLMALREVQPAYFGLLGPTHKRERLFSKFLEYHPDTNIEFFEKIHGPAGINIGAESASEIALSILAEILSVIRKSQPISLRDKIGHIHE
jgi:xanthine/CO dehydrogenase XdhC/CoxF family maturation factor